MESDDDFELFSPAESEAPSSHTHGRKLKRLKRAAEVVSVDPLVERLKGEIPPVNVPDSADPGPSNTAESSEEEAEEPSDRLQLSGRENGTDDDTTDFGSVPVESEENELCRGVELDSVDEEINVGEGLREGSREPGIGAPAEGWHELEQVGPSDARRNKKVEKKKRSDNIDDDIEQIKPTAVVNKRREEKERRERMQQLRADSQRVLRETRDASFKPMPMVTKPISSVLEKIRQRKLEISKRTVSVKSTNLASRYVDFSDEEGVEFDSEDSILQKREGAKEVVTEPTEKRIVSDARPTDEPHDIPDEPNTEHVTVQKTSQEEFKPVSRAPIDDTQKLFSDYQNNDTREDCLTDSPRSPMEEVFRPSSLATKLTFDSAPQISDDEGDNEKENVDPRFDREIDLSPLLKDPVKDFLDEEAEEEDDSDGDPFNSQQDDEEDDIEDAEELNDMIATNYVEKPIDNEMRNELHQKWLERQDAAGMENLLQRIKGAPKQREATLLEEEEDREEEEEEENEDEGEDEEEFGVAEGLDPRSLAQMNLRKAKQTISEMFTDKDDPYISSEDEESERILAKQSLSEKIKGQTRLLSPEEDESSREVFGRIKKLNIMSENKRRARPSALHDLSLTRSKTTAFLKPSFVGRGSNSSLPSKNKKTSTVRSFIFSRDDSNSRSTTSASEESSDTVQKGSRPTRTPSAKFSSSQTKFCSETTNSKVSSESDSTTSLYDILRRPSIKSDSCVREAAVDVRAQSIFAAFRIGKRSREGRVAI